MLHFFGRRVEPKYISIPVFWIVFFYVCILVFVYKRCFCALSYMCLYLMKMSILEELSDYLRLIDFSICLMIEGGWFEEVWMQMGVSFSFL